MFDFITYMEDVATKLKEIKATTTNKKFNRATSIANLEELLSNLRDVKEIIIIAISATNGAMLDNGDNPIDQPYFSFYICKQVNYNDHSAMESIKAECKKIAYKIVAKIRYDDSMSANTGNTYNGFSKTVVLNRKSFSYNDVGPIGSNFYGIEVSFTLHEFFSEMVYNSEYWDE